MKHLHYLEAEKYAIRDPEHIRPGRAYLMVHTQRGLPGNPHAQLLISTSTALTNYSQAHGRHMLTATFWVEGYFSREEERYLSDMGIWNGATYKNTSNYLLDLYTLYNHGIGVGGWPKRR